jgi:altronate hydrolase
MNQKALIINPDDNLIVALENLQKGEIVDVNGTKIRLSDDIPQKHKFTRQALRKGDIALMYGVVVGMADRDIPSGGLVTTSNLLHHTSGEIDLLIRKTDWLKPVISKWSGKTFMGYHRLDGQVGVRNYWLVVPLVFCENRNVLKIKEAIERALGYHKVKDYEINLDSLIAKYRAGASKEEILETNIILDNKQTPRNRVFKNIDGIKFLTHEGGCGGTRQDAKTLCNLLAGYINNPNVAGATFIGLGCQNAQVEMMKDSLHQLNPKLEKPVFFLEQQQYKKERELIANAIKKTFAGLMEADKTQRQPAPLSKLVLGLECGGSDGFSGISANPSLGYASDILVALGGTPILAEFPELNGVEQELVKRCVSREDAERFMGMMRRYSEIVEAGGSSFAANPSPGNIKDGLITDAMKSAGAAKKGGSSPIIKVLDYGEQVLSGGLNLLCTPGNDVESTTALAASGATMIVFTTGLGTPTGNPVAPVVKLSSNTFLSETMADIIDFNSGTVITGEDTIQSCGEKLFDYLVRVANGEAETKAEANGQDDFIPWKRDISL